MPIYEYRCTQCGHKLESLQKFSDAPLTTCPACGKEALSKLVSAAGFQLKGSGWYQTDFRGGSKPAAKTEGAEGAEGAKGESKEGGKAESGDASAGKESSTAGSSGDKAAASSPATPSAAPASPGTSAT